MHPAPENEVEIHIREGNRRLTNDLSRRLDVKKKILDSRPYPEYLSHWMEPEFISFLDEHHFPANTYRDRLRSRHDVIRDALSHGKYVPPQVLNEPSMGETINDAISAVQAHYAWLRLNQLAAESRKKFEGVIGYSNAPLDVFLARVNDLLKTALQQGRSNQKRTLLVPMSAWGYDMLELTYVEGRPARSGRFGSYGDVRSPAIRISYPGSLNPLFHLDWAYAEPQFKELLAAGDVTFDQVWQLTGTQWTPPGRATIEWICSTERQTNA